MNSEEGMGILVAPSKLEIPRCTMRLSARPFISPNGDGHITCLCNPNRQMLGA